MDVNYGNKEIWKFVRGVLPGLAKIVSEGIVLEGRKVSRSGHSSAVIFVPKCLAGQKVRIIIIPEDSALAGMRETLEKNSVKFNKINKERIRLSEENENLQSKIKLINKDTEIKNSFKPKDSKKDDLEKEDEF